MQNAYDDGMDQREGRQGLDIQSVRAGARVRIPEFCGFGYKFCMKDYGLG